MYERLCSRELRKAAIEPKPASRQVVAFPRLRADLPAVCANRETRCQFCIRYDALRQIASG
jgi:hypothetical protein